MKIRIVTEAVAEVEEARQFLTDRSLELGSRLLDEFSETLDQIVVGPEIFPEVESSGNECLFRHAILKTFQYFVVFEAHETEIVVVAVVPARRAPHDWLHHSE